MAGSGFPTTPIARLTGHDGPVHAVTFSAGSGQYVLTGCQDRSVRLFNPTSKHLIQTYQAHGYEVLDLCVAQDNRSFVSVGGDKTAFFWDVESAQATRRFQGHTARIHTCAFGGAGDSVLGGLVNHLDRRGRLTPGAVRSLTLQQWREAAEFAAHVAAVTVSRPGADPPWAGELRSD